MKCLLFKLEDLSLDPQTPTEKEGLIPVLGKTKQVDPWSLLISLSSPSVSSRFSETPCLQKIIVERD